MPVNFKKSLLATVIGCGLLAGGAANADLEANIGATSNYLWRGVTQTDDSAAIQGGLDYSHESGFYAGTWASNVDFGDKGYELDLYLGFGGEAGALGYDLGYIQYLYPVHDDADFGEVYLNLSYGSVGGGVALTVSNDDAALDDAVYYYLGVSGEVAEGFTLGGTVGHYTFDDSDADYTHVQLSLGKGTDMGDFTFAIDKNDIDDDDDPRVSVSWSKSF